MKRALESGATSGDGQFTALARRALEDLHGGAKALLTTSGTHALELAALVCELGPDDEVVLPSFTFASTANAFALRGCKLRFADIAPDTFSMEAAQIAAVLSPQTKVVVTVAYGGVLRDWEGVTALCHAKNLTLIEDNAHGLFARHRGRALGTFGRLSALSFHATKNISCGEGGALILNDAGLLQRAEILREKGTDRSRFLRGEVDKYTWRGIGSSYLPSDVLAAMLVAQLENSAVTQERRKSLWQLYRERLEPQQQRLGIRLQAVPAETEQPAHVFALLIPGNVERATLLRAMAARKIAVVSHYEPLHLAPAHTARDSLPVTEDVARRLVRLPLYAGLSPQEAQQVVDALVQELEGLS